MRYRYTAIPKYDTEGVRRELTASQVYDYQDGLLNGEGSCYSDIKVELSDPEADRDRLQRIRQRFLKNTMPHKFVSITVSQEEYLKGHHHSDHWCSCKIVDENGETRMTVSQCHKPLVDEEWIDDVGFLLSVIENMTMDKMHNSIIFASENDSNPVGTNQ